MSGASGTSARKPGSVYLAASLHRGTLQELARRALAEGTLTREARARPYIAASYAAAEGPVAERLNGFLAHAFGGAEVQRFTVKGEKRAMPPEKARAIVEAADVIFFGGGDPVHGARLLVDAGADEWIRSARARGTPCVGISAGSMMLCAWWASWPDSPPEDHPHHGGELVSCTRVVPDLVVDCHAEEDDWEELKLVRVMLEARLRKEEMPRMLGIPSGSGIVVGPGGTIESVGEAPFSLH